MVVVGHKEKRNQGKMKKLKCTHTHRHTRTEKRNKGNYDIGEARLVCVCEWITEPDIRYFKNDESR